MKKTGVMLGLWGAGVAVYALVVRPWHLRWGATTEEVEAFLPGDELVEEVTCSATHAVTIDAPVETVWAWVVQIGQDKGGFYSYTWLENLVGCEMRNAERIVPEFQHLAVGDSVWLHPKTPPLPVMRMEPGRHLVLGSNTNDPETWGFYLEALPGNRTRLIARGRGYWKPGGLSWILQYGVFEPAHFIMERKMLLSIKARAEKRMSCN